MSTSPTLIWLICCVVIVLGLVAIVAIATLRRLRREREVRAAGAWPDFEIVDCGDQIHFVPLEEEGHVLGSEQCPCQAVRTANRRRSGRHVIYVDHQSLHQHSPIS